MTPRHTLAEPGDLAGFPATPPPPRLVRVCRRENGTWWFSSDGSGRFDLEPPEGTCYFATDGYAAIREATRLGPVTPRWIADRELRRLAPSDPGARLAATTRRKAGGYGLTQELVTLLPYDLPRRWARAFHAHGFDGIRHQLRHDPRARPSGVSLFGRERGGTGRENPEAGEERVRLDREMVEGAGVPVLDPPDSAVLTVHP